MYVYIYIYVYICVCIYIYIYIVMYIYIYRERERQREMYVWRRERHMFEVAEHRLSSARARTAIKSRSIVIMKYKNRCPKIITVRRNNKQLLTCAY